MGIGVIIAFIVAILLAVGTAFGVVSVVNSQGPVTIDSPLVTYGTR